MVGSRLIFRMIDIGDAHAGPMAKANGVMAGLFYIVFGIIWVTMTIAIPSGIGPLFTIAGIVVILFGLRSIMRRPGYSRREDVPEDPARNLPESPVEPERHDGSSFGYCPYCGSPLEKGFNYCGVCGRKLRWSLP